MASFTTALSLLLFLALWIFCVSLVNILITLPCTYIYTCTVVLLIILLAVSNSIAGYTDAYCIDIMHAFQGRPEYTKNSTTSSSILVSCMLAIAIHTFC
jgi:hypothetical protein